MRDRLQRLGTVQRHAEQRRLAVLRLWQDKRRRSRSLDQLTDKLMAEARVRADAAQQKIDDAMALSRLLRGKD